MINLLCADFTSVWTYPLYPGSACLFLFSLLSHPLDRELLFLLGDKSFRYTEFSTVWLEPLLNLLFVTKQPLWCWWRSWHGLLGVACVLEPVFYSKVTITWNSSWESTLEQVRYLGFLSCTPALCAGRTLLCLDWRTPEQNSCGSVLTSATDYNSVLWRNGNLWQTWLVIWKCACVEASSTWASDSMNGE